jgi:tetratricopeptide (TPR) repeat protein
MKPTLYFFIFSFAVVLANDLFAGKPSPDPIDDRLKKIPSDTETVNILLKNAEALIAGNTQQAVKDAVKAVWLAKQSRSKKHIKQSLNVAGKASFYAGLLPEAAKFFSESSALIAPNAPPLELAMLHNNIGSVELASRMGKYDAKAETHFRKALQYLQKYRRGTDDAAYYNISTSVYNNLAVLLRYKGTSRLAEGYIKKGLALIQGRPDYYTLQLRLIANYGDLLLQEKRYAESLEFLEKGLRLSKEKEDALMQFAFIYYLGTWYDKKGDAAEALRYYTRYYENARAEGNHTTIREVARNLSALYEKTGDAAQALKFLRISTDSEEKIKIAETKQELAKAELQASLKALQEEMAAESNSVAKRYRIALGLSAGLALVGLLLYFLYRRKYRIAQLHSMEKERAARKLQLDKELLEAELEAKGKHLTTEIIDKLRKNEIIEDIVKKLLPHTRTTSGDTQKALGDIVRSLQSFQDKAAMEEFEMRFRQVDQDFYQKIHEVCPDLTTTERRLCAFLRLNMNTKEISALTGQTVRAIEIGRTRLRKKLDLTHTDTSLVEFLSSL